MAMKMTIFSPTTTFHHCCSLSTTLHRLLPFPSLTRSTGSVVVRNTKVISENGTKEHPEVLKIKDLPHTSQRAENVKDKILHPSDKIKESIERIKVMLNSMDDGEINASAYDTAWVALIQDINGIDRPQFPSCLEWIINNQLPDGSWGDRLLFLAHDRIINTLACTIALTTWNVHPCKCQKGVEFLKENISKLEEVNMEHMPIGFEIVFPALIDIARKLEIEVPENTSALNEIYAMRNLKVKKIPKDIMHAMPTTLLYSLEGIPDLEWDKLLNLQCKNGSFLFSLSSTAFAFMQTKDEKCLQYLTNIVAKFNGGVPSGYPVDLFEHIWVVDRLQRLGISRYFDLEIKNCVEYIHRYWTNDGICWAKHSNVEDIDDTAMGFRILRMHGYVVTPDVLRQFENNGKFVCFPGQSTQAITGMFNLYRASQFLFPGEKILEDAKKFSFNYLKEKQSTKKLLDKWIIAKDLPGEVGYALDMPWYASLPRLETRFYLEQYGGEDDVWIGKTLYRMGKVSNNTYLELAKADYNNCVAIHRIEWENMQQWYTDFGIAQFGMGDINSLLVSYYLAAANLFEVERFTERIAWAKTTALADTISAFFDSPQFSNEDKTTFLDEFKNTPSSIQNSKNNGKPWHGLMVALQGTLHEIAMDTLLFHKRHIHPQLHDVWEMWLTRWQLGMTEGRSELIVETINLTAGRLVSKELLAHPQYQRMSTITNSLCHELHKSKEMGTLSNNGESNTMIDSKMQELVQLLFTNSSEDLDRDMKQTFMTVARTLYYKALCEPETINAHISKVLFENII